MLFVYRFIYEDHNGGSNETRISDLLIFFRDLGHEWNLAIFSTRHPAITELEIF